MRSSLFLLVILSCASLGHCQPAGKTTSWIDTGEFQWKQSEPIVSVETATLPASPEHPWVSIKDPSIVRFEDRWHLFCSLRKQKAGDGRIRIGYTSFSDWADAASSRWDVLTFTPGYHGAPQVFYFAPQQIWYLIYQAEDATRDLPFGPCYSTNQNLSDPDGWTLPKPLYRVKPGAKAGLDFWVICDDDTAFLFFTTLDGRMWRAETPMDQFPDRGWSEPQVVLRDDLFEASHTYRIQGTNRFLTVVEAQNGGQGRYYKAYLADSLRGEWKPLANTFDHPFASIHNVQRTGDWTDSYSHGELIRIGYDQTLTIDGDSLSFVFQGATEREYQRTGYGEIPWKLGILSLAPER